MSLAKELKELKDLGLDEAEFNELKAVVIEKYKSTPVQGENTAGGANNADHAKALARLRWWGSLGPIQKYDALKSKSYTCVTMDQASLLKLFEQKDMMSELVDITVRFKANYSPSTEMVAVAKDVVLGF